MMKLFTFVCILGLFSIVQATNFRRLRINDKRECTVVFWGPDPEPTCQTYTDENGEEQEDCFGVGAPEARAILNSSVKTLEMSDSQIQGLYYYGDCSCSLKLWTKANYKGAVLEYAFSNSTDKTISTTDIWSKTNQSFKVICEF